MHSFESEWFENVLGHVLKQSQGGFYEQHQNPSPVHAVPAPSLETPSVEVFHAIEESENGDYLNPAQSRIPMGEAREDATEASIPPQFNAFLFFQRLQGLHSPITEVTSHQSKRAQMGGSG